MEAKVREKRIKSDLPAPSDHTRIVVLCFQQLPSAARVLHFETGGGSKNGRIRGI